MINRRLFAAASTAVLFGCFISAALSACGNGNSYGDTDESESYRLSDYSYGDTSKDAPTETVPITEDNKSTMEEAVSSADGTRPSESVAPSVNPVTTEEYTKVGQGLPEGGTSVGAPSDNKTSAAEYTLGNGGDRTEPSSSAAAETGSTQAQSSEAFLVQNPIRPIDHSVEFFFKVPGYTGKSYYDLYLHDGFVPVDSVNALGSYCEKNLLTLAHGKKSVNYIITPKGLFDEMSDGLARLDEKAAGGDVTDIYARDAYLYERLGLDYQTYYSRGIAIFKIKKMGDVGNGKHSVYAVYYYSYEDSGQAALVDETVSRVAEGFKGSDYDKILAAYKYLCDSTVYGRQEDSYEAHSAYGALVSGSAVCEGYAKAYKLLLDKMNIPNYIVINSTHAWNVVLYDGEWYFVDVTNGDFNSCCAYFMLGGDVLCSEADLLVDSYIFTAEAIAYYGYTDGNNTDTNTLAASSVPERDIAYR
ncbi:MAG: hypothetical protein NC223_05660 [Butyrivibrio sp.]|nr:hypothetical protein [Butyrivibrio sp.]